MNLLRRRSLKPSSAITSEVKWVKDRALDHVVEREKHLIPFISLKDHFFNFSPVPPHSLPLSSITPHKSSLSLPFRPLDFLRLFPSCYAESLLPNQPILQFTPSKKLVLLHDEEMSICKDDVAERLVKLLMISPERKLPIWVVEKLRWDLGLPFDFVKTVLGDYPDCFRVRSSEKDEREMEVELVCYRKDLAISTLERRAESTGDYSKGSPLSFPLIFPKGFEPESKIKKHLNEFQSLPYISPYERFDFVKRENKSVVNLTEKWTVGVLHEILNVFITKKIEKNKLVLLGERLKLPPGFRKVIGNYNGIFYTSDKLGTQTVVLREGYKRNLLVEKNSVADLRSKYLHLMHKGKPSGGKKGKEAEKKDKEERERELEEFDEERESEFDEERESEFDEEEESEEEEGEEEEMVVNRVGERKSGGFKRGERKFSDRKGLGFRKGGRKMKSVK